MHIAMVSEHASPLAVLGGHDAGGQNVHVAALSSALADRGHRVTVFTRRDDPDLPARQPLCAGVDVVHVSAGPARAVPKDDLLPYVPELGRGLAAAWRDDPPDVVHTHFWMSGLAARIACGLLTRQPPLVVTFHALGVVKQRHQGAADTSPPERQGVERDLAQQAHAVVATCRDEVSELLDLGADPERLHVVPCGVDLRRFAPVGTHDVPWRPGMLRLLSLGRLVERKGVETAVQALAQLPDAELVVAGGPPPERRRHDEDVLRLETSAREAGVADRVCVLGAVSPERAARLLRAADLLLAVPWYEPFGIVPLEAMASGTPVVASAVGGMLDTVVDGVTGRHVPPRDPQALADAVRQLALQPELLRRMGSAGVEHVRSRFSWSTVAAETEAVYASLLGASTTDDDVVDLRDPVVATLAAPTTVATTTARTPSAPTTAPSPGPTEER